MSFREPVAAIVQFDLGIAKERRLVLARRLQPDLSLIDMRSWSSQIRASVDRRGEAFPDGL